MNDTADKQPFMTNLHELVAENFQLPLPPMRPRQCADQRLVGPGVAGAHASPPSGAMMTLRPPRRFQVTGMWTVIVRPPSLLVRHSLLDRLQL
jgi:hypothetical protein